MIKRISLPILIAILLTLAVGCDQDAPGPSSQVQLEVPTQFFDKAQYPEVTTELLDSLDYEVMSASIQPGLGGVFQMTMKTWQNKAVFSIFVPQDALPTDNPYPVEFSMKVPTYQSYMDHINDPNPLPLIIRLEPSDINFAADVLVGVTYMPWAPVDDPPNFIYGELTPAFEEGQGSIINLRKTKIGWQFLFPVPHFSDWAGVGGVAGK